MKSCCERIAGNIRALRATYGISRKALAKLVCIPVGRLRRIENSDLTARLYDYHLLRISRVFDISVETLVNGEIDRK